MRSSLFLALLPVTLLLPGCVNLLESRQDRLANTARYQEMEAYMEDLVKDASKADTDDLVSLCLAYSKTKRYNKLFPCLDRFEQNIQKGDRKHVKGNLITGRYTSDVSAMPHLLRAEALMELQDYDRALKEAEKGLAAVPSGIMLENYYASGMFPPRLLRAQAYATMGLIHAFRGDRASAVKYYNLLDGMYVGGFYAGSSRPHTKAGVEMALARLDMVLGNYPAVVERLRPSFDEVRDIIGKTLFAPLMPLILLTEGSLSVENMSLAYNLLPARFMYHKALLETGNLPKAKDGYDDLLRLPKIRDNGEINWMILYDRGRIAEKENQRAEAADFYRKAVDVIESQRASISTESSKIGFVGNKQDVYRDLIAVLFADNQYAAAFEYIERAKARALVDMLAAKQNIVTAGSANAEQVRLLLAQNNTAEAEARVQDESANTAHHRSLAVQTRAQLQQQAPELASLVSVTSVAVQDLQGRLPADEVLIEYYAEGKELYAFVLSRDGIKGHRLDGEGLTAEVQRFREAVQDEKSTRHQELAAQLYNRLVKPLQDSLTQPNLLIVAHGALHYLPFNALHDGNSYLIDRYSVRQLPSASVLKYLKGKPAETAGILLAFGNPDLGDPALDLRHAQAEAMTVAGVLPNSRALVRKEANLAAFKRYAGGFKYLHFASHGEFNADSPLASALLLSPEGQSDGRLTVNELYSTRLEADLVTLSACETGLGKIANGDDVVGLTRGFLYAGARSIVASLWKVDDEATAVLMTRFYQSLGTTGKRQALRQAQLDTRARFDHPYYWAAFQLTGEAE